MKSHYTTLYANQQQLTVILRHQQSDMAEVSCVLLDWQKTQTIMTL
jgi:hypothetical protein